jgi:hypothetical protein
MPEFGLTQQHLFWLRRFFLQKCAAGGICGLFLRTIHGTWAAIYTEFEISVNLFSGKSGAIRAENTPMIMERNLFSTTTTATTTGAQPVPSGAQPTTTPCRPIC